MKVPVCPICGSAPVVEKCEPWNKEDGPQPWHAGCWDFGRTHHYVGANGDNERDAELNWTIAVNQAQRTPQT